jgi:tRNA threonylcarbamoyladenosine biosynthesis protein TsaE
MTFESSSPSQTAEISARIARGAKPGAVLALCGPLGAGKTAFVQGYAQGLGYTGAVTSPTFTLLHHYEGGALPLFHFDLYRLGGESAGAEGIINGESLEEIGFFEHLHADGVCLVEWADYARAYLPENTLWVDIARDPNRDWEYRRITCRSPEGGPA